MRQVYGDMGEFFHALRVFGDQLASVSWTALALALALHFTKVFVRTFAWRNILAAAYPEERVPRGFAILRDRPRYFREVASWQLLSWVLRIASLYWFLRAFHVHASIHNALLAQVVDSLATLLPFSPGGAGTKQGLLVYVLEGQASTSRLLAFSVGMHVAI